MVRLKDLKEQLDMIEERLNTISRRMTLVDERLDNMEGTVYFHEHNHHGAKSKILHGVPFTIIAGVVYGVLKILGL